MFAELRDLFLARDSAASSGPRLAHWLLAISRLTDIAEGRPMRHGLRVAMVCYHLGKLFQLPLDSLRHAVTAALLHDVGLLPLLPKLAAALPPVLGEKHLLAAHRAWQHGLVTWSSVTLSDTARRTLEHHPNQAKSLLQDWRLDAEVAHLLAACHEQWNGQGYPAGLSGDRIPLGAQLVGLADLLEGLLTPNLTPAQREQQVRSVLTNPATRAQWNPALIDRILDALFEDPWWYRDIFASEAEVVNLLPQDALHPAQLLACARQVATWVENLSPPHWQGHCLRVAEMAQQMASQLGVDSTQQGQLVLAGLWHEAGKLAWPVNLLNKADPFNQPDWQAAHMHPQLAADALNVIPGCQTVASWIAEHHERMNGSGYPGGMKGVHISIAGRLLAMCDVYDALTHPRPYRAMAFGTTEALSLMSEQRNRLFDANLFNVFKDVVMSHTTVYSQLQAAV
jgi:HD-GYP domain-containing protein (c-di-GMP phosphodiesterase class II)